MQVTRNSNFEQLTGQIRSALPVGYLAGIVGSYIINALLITFFLLPILSEMFGQAAPWIAIPGAFVVQYFRFLIVFTDQLQPGGRSSAMLVNIVALAMTVWGVAEVYHLTSAFNLESSEFWGVFGFAASVIIAGYILEISFVRKTNELTGKHNAPTLPTRTKGNGATVPAAIDLSELLSSNGNGNGKH